jgi:hypothetical protein
VELSKVIDELLVSQKKDKEEIETLKNVALEKSAVNSSEKLPNSSVEGHDFDGKLYFINVINFSLFFYLKKLFYYRKSKG